MSENEKFDLEQYSLIQNFMTEVNKKLKDLHLHISKYNEELDKNNFPATLRLLPKITLKIKNLDEILKKAEEIEKNSNQLLNYTNIIKQNSLEIKKDIIEHLWKVLISDNAVDQYESNLMRRICGLIYFSDKDCAEIKLNLLNSK